MNIFQILNGKAIVKTMLLVAFGFISTNMSYAQSDIEIVLVSEDKPTDGLNTYEFVMTNAEYINNIATDANYINELNAKLSEVSQIEDVTINTADLSVAMILRSDLLETEVMDLIKILNPAGERMIDKP